MNPEGEESSFVQLFFNANVEMRVPVYCCFTYLEDGSSFEGFLAVGLMAA